MAWESPQPWDKERERLFQEEHKAAVAQREEQARHERDCLAFAK